MRYFDFQVKIKNSTWLFVFLLGAGLLWIYGQQFQDDSFLFHDDPEVIRSMDSIFSIQDYVSARARGIIWDIQPVRDVVTGINYFILNQFNLSLFHLANVLIWFVTMLGTYKLMRVGLKRSAWFAGVFTLFIAFNPLYVTSVSWLSARKHLLAACFIVWASYHTLQWIKSAPKAILRLSAVYVLYSLAVFSQPIVLLWPFSVLLIVLYFKQYSYLKWVFPLFAVMGWVAYLNHTYYSGPTYLLLSSGTSKYLDDNFGMIGVRLMLIGRYFFQTLIPYWTSISIYDVKAWQGLVGLFLIPVSVLVLLKRLPRSQVVIAGLFFILMLAPVVGRVTNIYGSDTYLITASIGAYALWAHYFSTYKLFASSNAKVLICFMLLIFLQLSHQRAAAWDSDVNVYRVAKDLEQSTYASQEYIRSLMRANRSQEAALSAQDLLQLDPEARFARGIISVTIATDSRLSIPQKAELLRKNQFTDPLSLQALAKLEFAQEHFESAEALLLEVLKTYDWSEAVAANPESFGALLSLSCWNGSNIQCAEKLEMLTSKVRLVWQSPKYQRELALVNQQFPNLKKKGD